MSEAVPKGWEDDKISNIVERVIDNRGKTPPLASSGYELLEINSLSESRRFPDYAKVRKYVDKATYDSWFRAGHPKQGDILIPTVGTIGICCILNESRGAIAQNIIGLRVNNENHPPFAYYALSGYRTVKQIELVVMNAVQPSLKVPQFLDLKIFKPPLPEQQRIASILTSVDEVIEKTEFQIRKLQDLKKGMMQELLTKGIGHTEFKDSPVGRIPKEWRICAVGDLLEFKNGLNKEKKYFGYGNPIVNFNDVFHNDGITIGDIKGRVSLSDAELDRFRVERGDVFFTRTSETPEEIGMASVFLDSFDNVSFSGFVLRGRQKTSLLLDEYCKYCFSTDYVRRQIISSCSYTTRALTNGTLLSQINVVIPSRDEQEAIYKSIDSVCGMVKSKQRLLSSYKDIKKSLMQDLLTGKVRVKTD